MRMVDILHLSSSNASRHQSNLSMQRQISRCISNGSYHTQTCTCILRSNESLAVLEIEESLGVWVDDRHRMLTVCFESWPRGICELTLASARRRGWHIFPYFSMPVMLQRLQQNREVIALLPVTDAVFAIKMER